ncbi:histidine phosphatase family protein [Niallia sp. MER TA 168]|uniref:histidine phosphatase family protein n=1 Tax=Niallia sp. MER TA 168 TaxID=2939568 RepID=UPI00203ED32F|nr:histidine phosphatase family protein [Niallia sp. MER TA 168]MCM3364831.1 histidine phosphatase family protein [Niallia sp. MER TA 168]
MLTLYITRHGETKWNTEKRMQGWSDSSLTENGVKNAILLGNRLKDIEFDAIHTSPSQRTIITANLIKGDRKIPLIPDDQLKEINMGIWEGETLADLKDNYPEQFDFFWNAPHQYKSINGEDFFEVKKRVSKALKMIQDKYSSGNILLVTHSVVIKVLLAIFKELPIEKIWEPPFIYDTSLTVVEMVNDTAQIVLEGDLTHRQDK